MCRAANALHSGCLKWLESALNDADLRGVIVAWKDLPEAIRVGVMAMVGSVVAQKAPAIAGSAYQKRSR
jgi:hypothetical protein